MIIALFDNTTTVDTLLNNLSEAEFNLEDVSVITRDAAQSEALLPGQTLLRGALPESLAKTLIKQGLSEEAANQCQEAVTNGRILVIMNAPEEYRPAAEEIFQDHSAQLIQG